MSQDKSTHDSDQDKGLDRSDEDLLASLDDGSGDREEWTPEVGDRILGDVVRFEHPKVPKTDRHLPIVVLDTEAGPVRVAVKHTVLANELRDREAQIGDRIVIRFDGQPDGKRYLKYTVRVAPNGPRDPAKRFTVKPMETDSDDLTEEALETNGDDESSPSW